MKKVKVVMYVGAVLFAVYAVVNFCLGCVTYSEYIEYYGFMQVFPTIADLFFSTAGWAFLLFGIGAICGHFAKQEAVLDAIDVVDDDEEADFELVPEADAVEQEAEEAVEAAEEAEEAVEEMPVKVGLEKQA